VLAKNDSCGKINIAQKFSTLFVPPISSTTHQHHPLTPTKNTHRPTIVHFAPFALLFCFGLALMMYAL